MTAPGPLPAGQPRDALVGAVRVALDEAGIPGGAAVIVAVSGGPDSTALAYLAAEARPDLDLTLVHVRHGLRDDRADREVLAQHAGWLGVPLRETDVEVVRRGRGLEDAARHARYTALGDAARAVGASWTLVGHTADDQAETVLLRLARGTGTTGIGAMAPVRGDLVRPLLRIRRADLRGFLELEGLPSVEDPSNLDPQVRRSRVRHEVLDAVGRVGPDPVGALARLADLARDDAVALDRWADQVVRRARRRVGPVIAIPDEALAEVPVAVARRVIRRLVAEAGEDHDPPTAASVTRVLELGNGRAAHLPGNLVVTAGGGWRALAPHDLPVAEPQPLAVPGTTRWDAARLQVTVITPEVDPRPDGEVQGQIALELEDAWSPPEVESDRGAVPPGGVRDRLRCLLPGSLPPLAVRARRPGDRIATRAGTQRLQDVFVDAGVPRPIRALWPVVATEDRVVWVPGLAADAALLAAGRATPGALLVCERPRSRPTR